MSAKTKLILPFLILAVILAGYSFTQNPPPPPVSQITLKVVKVNDTWRVKVESIDENTKIPEAAEVHVNKKTMITWEVEGTDAYFQFPNEIFDTTASGTNRLSDGYTILIRDGHKLKLKIKDDDKLLGNIYVYSVFCTADNVYAWGNSPPKIIVE